MTRARTPQQQRAESHALEQARLLLKTKTYQQLRQIWITRRERLLATDPTSSEQLWQLWGAIRELTQNLQHPDLMADYLERSAAEEEAQASVPTMPGWLQQSAGVDLA